MFKLVGQAYNQIMDERKNGYSGGYGGSYGGYGSGGYGNGGSVRICDIFRSRSDVI